MRAPSEEEASPTPELEIELPPRPEFVRVARHAVGALARLHEVPDDVVDDIKLAVSEACTQAIASAADGDGEPLAVRAWAGADRMAIELADPTSTLLREVAGPPSDLDTEDLPFDRALALPVIRGLVDELAVTPRGDQGATLRMVITTGESTR